MQVLTSIKKLRGCNLCQARGGAQTWFRGLPMVSVVGPGDRWGPTPPLIMIATQGDRCQLFRTTEITSCLRGDDRIAPPREEEANHRCRRLLRPRCERPSRRAPEPRDELSAFDEPSMKPAVSKIWYDCTMSIRQSIIVYFAEQSQNNEFDQWGSSTCSSTARLGC
jgi:hypothetical protein